jgi:hypothetical protein
MAQERLRTAGELIAYELSWIVRIVTGVSHDPERINPYRHLGIISTKRGVSEGDNRRAWAILGQALKEMR